MESTALKSEEVLVLVDQHGVYYAIPREVLEQHRATNEQRVEIEAMRGEDVTGYGNFGALDLFIQEQTVGGFLAERRDEANRERVLHDKRQAIPSGPAAPEEREPGFINVIAAFTTWLTPTRSFGP